MNSHYAYIQAHSFIMSVYSQVLNVPLAKILYDKEFIQLSKTYRTNLITYVNYLQINSPFSCSQTQIIIFYCNETLFLLNKIMLLA